VLAAWYAAFALYAGVVAVFSGPGDDRSWGIWAAAAYMTGALAAGWWRRHGRSAALILSLGGALVAPVSWLATHAPPTPDMRVVSRSAGLMLRHGTPYLSPPQLTHMAGPFAYNPYLPVMSLFGLPRAWGLPGIAGDPRLWLAVSSLALFAVAFRVAGRRDALCCGLFAIASPVVAFPLALGVTDPPVLALVCLALALLSRTSRTLPVWPAAVVLGVACAMKATAWPALPVVAAMLAARDGVRAAVRFIAYAAATGAVLAVAFAPAAIAGPAALIQNTVLFPLGLTRVKTPAASPMPGHLLSAMGPAGRLIAIGLLIAALLAMAISLVVRPPKDGTAATRRLALGLILMFVLSPATRFGYFTYPIGLVGWLAVSRSPRRDPAPQHASQRASERADEAGPARGGEEATSPPGGDEASPARGDGASPARGGAALPGRRGSTAGPAEQAALSSG
jgi:phosphatidylinositol alpha-1,6-mannosyltransferase